jgi:hypothetical protein
MRLTDQIYGLMLALSLMLQIALLSFLPFIGRVLSFVYSCWLWSFSSFE